MKTTPFSRLPALVCIGIVALAAAPGARAQVHSINGILSVASPTFTLTTGAFNPLSLHNGLHPYDLFSFQLNQAATVTVTMNRQAQGATPGLIDPAVLLYQGTFGPSGYTPVSAGYVGGNDDIQNGVQRNSRVTLNLAANTTYTAVFTTWQSDLGVIAYPTESQFGGYLAALDSGGATLTIVPEPGTYGALLGAAVLAVVAGRRYRRKAQETAGLRPTVS